MVKMRLVLIKHLSIKDLPWRRISVSLRAKVNRIHCFLCSILLGLQPPLHWHELWNSTQEWVQCKWNRQTVFCSHRWTQPTSDFAHTLTLGQIPLLGTVFFFMNSRFGFVTANIWADWKDGTTPVQQTRTQVSNLHTSKAGVIYLHCCHQELTYKSCSGLG